MKKFLHLLWLPLVIVPMAWLYSCSHTNVDKKIDSEVQAETAVHSTADAAAEGAKIVSESKTLSADQKAKILNLQKSVGAKVTTLREEEAKLKAVLFKSLVDPSVSGGEIARIRNRIVTIDHDKTNLMLNALDEAQKILGRKSRDDEHIFRALMMDRPDAGRDM